MKKLILASLSGLLLLSSCSKNDVLSPQGATTVNVANVPQVVLTSLARNFPTATQTVWIQTSPTAYMATFKQNSTARTATFQNTGAFMKAGEVIDPATLPTAITDYLTANYAGYSIVQADVKKDATGTVKGYETLIMVGTTQYELEFDATGKFPKLETPDGHAEGNGIAQSALLPAISTYLTTTYSGYTFKEAESRMTNGTITGYKVEIVQNSTKYDLLFDAAGVFVSVNTGGKGDGPGGDNHDGLGGDKQGKDSTIVQSALPAAIATYMTANYAGFVFVSAKIEKDGAGKVTGYDVYFTLAGKQYEAEFDAAGKFLKLEN